MQHVIPMRLTEETGDDLFEDLSPDERAVKILEREFPILCNDIGMLVCRPFTLIWDSTISTASTDCKAEIMLSPRFFIEGHRDVGYGTAYHECGHIRHSPYGVKLLQRCDKEGGSIRRMIMNIILDRKDDMLTVKDASGFAVLLRLRLTYICTMTRREELKEELQRRGIVDERDIIAILKHFKPRDCYEDFFFAAKWHKSPRFKEVSQVMKKYLARRRLLNASPAYLFWVAEQIHKRLGDPPERKEDNDNSRFATLMALALLVERGESPPFGEGRMKLSPSLAQALKQMVQRYLATARTSGLKGLIQRLKTMGMVHAGPLSTGGTKKVPLKKVKPGAQYASAYHSLLTEVESQIYPLTQRLRKIDNPSEFEIFGQDEGELDLSESARIATGLTGFHLETVTERDIDAEIHLALDCSGSMAGEKLHSAKKLAVVFSEAISILAPACAGRLWAFNAEAIYDFGPPSNMSGFVTIEGEAGNSDTHMLKEVGSQLGKSQKRRKVLLVLCDDGPDDMKEAKKLSHQLMARGVVVVHLLVGVHGTPSIYPFELLYASMDECLNEFGDLIESIVKNLK